MPVPHLEKRINICAIGAEINAIAVACLSVVERQLCRAERCDKFFYGLPPTLTFTIYSPPVTLVTQTATTATISNVKTRKIITKTLFAHCATQYKNNHKLLSHSRIFVMCCRRVNCKLWCCNHFTNYVVNFVNHILLATIDFGYLINRTFFSLFFCSVKFKAKAIIR